MHGAAIALGSTALLVLLPAQTTSPARRGAADWQRFLGERAAAPGPEELPALLDALTALLASPDPALRDDVAYTLLAKWITRDGVVPAAQCGGLVATWSARLAPGLGERGTDAVAGRSFAALGLSLLAARDLDAPFLDGDGFDLLLQTALGYLRDEQDVRGFDERLGWLHSVAHTADLLKFLGRSPHLRKEQQRAVLDGIGAKLAAVPAPLVAGEDERLARAILSLCARGDFDRDGFAAWLRETCGRRYDGAPAAALARRENRKHVLVSLFALLVLDGRPAESIAAARDALRAALGG